MHLDVLEVVLKPSFDTTGRDDVRQNHDPSTPMIRAICTKTWKLFDASLPQQCLYCQPPALNVVRGARRVFIAILLPRSWTFAFTPDCVEAKTLSTATWTRIINACAL